MADVLREPVFWTALLGVTGILATFFAPTWNQGRIERRRDRRDFRRAKRLIIYELDANRGSFEYMLETKRVWSLRDLRDRLVFPHDAWKAERAILATLLKDEDWEGLDGDFGFIEVAVNELIEVSDTAESTPLPDDTAKVLSAAVEAANDASDKLRKARPVRD
jgi:hypothetical protein